MESKNKKNKHSDQGHSNDSPEEVDVCLCSEDEMEHRNDHEQKQRYKMDDSGCYSPHSDVSNNEDIPDDDEGGPLSSDDENEDENLNGMDFNNQHHIQQLYQHHHSNRLHLMPHAGLPNPEQLIMYNASMISNNNNKLKSSSMTDEIGTHESLNDDTKYVNTTKTATPASSKELSFGISRILTEDKNLAKKQSLACKPSTSSESSLKGVLNQQSASSILNGLSTAPRPPHLAGFDLSAGMAGYFHSFVTKDPNGSGSLVIKVPAHRPGVMGYPPGFMSPDPNNPVLFPWMQERKDRLTSMYTLFSCTTF